MKTTKFILPLFLVMPFLATAQNAAVDAALQKGNAEGLTAHFAKSVDLLLLGVEHAVPGYQATALLKDFFSDKVVKGYRQNHFNAAQNGRSSHTIGDLVTGAGTYRISIFYDAAKKISEIRIE